MLKDKLLDFLQKKKVNKIVFTPKVVLVIKTLFKKVALVVSIESVEFITKKLLKFKYFSAKVKLF